MDVFVTVVFYSFLMALTSVMLPKALKYKAKGKKSRYYLYFLGLIVFLALVAAFRGTTGADSQMYLENYNRQYFRNSYRSFERGFILIFRVLYALKLPYQAMFFLISFIQNFFVFKLIEHESEYIIVKLAAFIYIPTLYLNSFNGMRQMVAVAVCMYAILLYLDDKKIKAIALVIIAAQLHRISYIVLLVIFAKIVYGLKSKLITYMTFALVLFFVFNRSLLNELYHLFSGQYTGYLSQVNEGDGSVIGFIIKNFIFIIVPILAYRSYKESPKYYTIFGIYTIGMLLKMLEYFTHTQVGRVGYFFTYMEIVLLPFAVNHKLYFNGKSLIPRKQIALFIGAYYYIIFLYNYAYKNFSELVPYRGFFVN